MSELSPEERRKIYEEEKAKIETARKEKIERQYKTREHLNRQKKFGCLVIGAIIIIVIAMYVIYNVIDFTSSDYGKSGRSKKTTTITRAKVINASGPIYKDRGDPGFEYFGVVRNVGGKSVMYVKIYVYLYDFAGNLLDAEWFAADKSPLNPNEQSPWSGTFPDAGRKIRKKLDKSRTKIEIEIVN